MVVWPSLNVSVSAEEDGERDDDDVVLREDEPTSVKRRASRSALGWCEKEGLRKRKTYVNVSTASPNLW
jgi:hypothetical protein